MSNSKIFLANVFAAAVVLAAAASPASAVSFDALYTFGDSTVDSGWWKGALNGQCGSVTPSCTTGNDIKDAKIQSAIDNGGTGAPVGVGLMHTQILASYYGVTSKPTNQSGGTNYAISGAYTTSAPGSGNANPNPNLPSTVDQINTYLGTHFNNADANALYQVSSGGNDITYAQSNAFSNLAQREAFLAQQAQSLAAAIKVLQIAGAANILVDGTQGSGTLSVYFTSRLFADLNNLGVNYIGADIAGMIQNVENHPTDHGFTAATVFPGMDGPVTGSACVAGTGASGWGQWCANSTDPSLDHSHLRASDSEQTSFWSDDQHLSAAGQQIEADYEYRLIEARFATTPLPATLPLFAGGLGAIGFVGWRRKRKARAA